MLAYELLYYLHGINLSHRGGRGECCIFDFLNIHIICVDGD